MGRTKETSSHTLEEIAKELEKVTQLLRERNSAVAHLVVRRGERAILISTDEIDWIEADGDYIRIHKGKDSLNLRTSMKRVEAQLNRKRFVRVHRSVIVNINRVVELQRMFHGGFQLILTNGTRLTLSRHYRSNFEHLVG